MIRHQINLTEETADALAKAAKETGRTKSDITEAALWGSATIKRTAQQHNIQRPDRPKQGRPEKGKE